MVELDFDMRCRRIEGPHGVNRAGDGRVAIAYGPVVLTRCECFDPDFDKPADIADDDLVGRALRADLPSRLAFDIPLRGGGTIPMTDYASADCWSGSRIRTWVPQPPCGQ